MLLHACHGNDHTDATWPVVDIDQLPDTIFDCRSLVRQARIVPLAPEPLVGGIDKVVGRDARFYVLDKTGVQVLAFDRNGHFVRKFGKLGDGPGEFESIFELVVPSHSDQVIVLKPWTLMFFDTTGKFHRETPLEFMPSRLGSAGQPDVFCYSTSFDDPQFFVHCIDVRGKIVSKHLPSTRKVPPHADLSNVSGMLINGPDNRVYVNYPGSSKVYTLRKGRFEPMIQFVGNRFWPEARKEDIEAFIDRLYAMDDFGYLHKYQIVNTCGAFTFMRDKRIQSLYYFFDSGKAYGARNFTDNALRNFLNSTPVGYTEDGGIIFVLDEERKMWLENRYQNDLSPLVPDLIPSPLWQSLSETRNNPILVILYFQS